MQSSPPTLAQIPISFAFDQPLVVTAGASGRPVEANADARQRLSHIRTVADHKGRARTSAPCLVATRIRITSTVGHDRDVSGFELLTRSGCLLF